MEKDAKLGLVVGVGVVIAVALVFFRKDLVNAVPPGREPAAAVNSNTKATSSGSLQSREKSAKDKKSAEPEKTESVPQATPRHHLTKEGETLATLAEKYYGDTAKSKDIFEANKSILKSPEALPIGTDLIIPEVPITPAEEDETPGM